MSSHSTFIAFTGALFAGALLLSASALEAQNPARETPPVPRATTSPVTPQLAPLHWTFVPRLIGASQVQQLGFRFLTVTASAYRATPAWLIVDTKRVGTVSVAESLYVRQTDLAPLYRIAHGDDGTEEAVVGSDSIRTTFDSAGTRTTVAVPYAPNVALSMSMIEALLHTAPLSRAWHTTVQLAALGRESGAVVPVELRTTGEDSTLVPDGTFACWVVKMTVGKGSQTLWVRKSDHVIVKEHVPVAGMPGVELEQLLALGGTK